MTENQEEIGSGPRVHDTSNCPTYYDGCNCPDVIDELERQIVDLRTVLENIAYHDPLTVAASSGLVRIWYAYLLVKDIAHQTIGFTGDEIRERYLKTDENGVPLSAMPADIIAIIDQLEALEAQQ